MAVVIGHATVDVGVDYLALLAWLTGDRETRGLKVDIRANDPTDADAIWSWSYSIEASDWWVYGGPEDEALSGVMPSTFHGPMGSSVTFHGSGESLNEAAGRVLQSMREHAEQVPT